MHRKPSSNSRNAAIATLIGIATIVVGAEVRSSHGTHDRSPARYLAVQADRSDDFVAFMPNPSSDPDFMQRIDISRECKTGIDTSCIYQ